MYQLARPDIAVSPFRTTRGLAVCVVVRLAHSWRHCIGLMVGGATWSWSLGLLTGDVDVVGRVYVNRLRSVSSTQMAFKRDG